MIFATAGTRHCSEVCGFSQIQGVPVSSQASAKSTHAATTALPMRSVSVSGLPRPLPSGWSQSRDDVGLIRVHAEKEPHGGAIQTRA